MSGIPSMPSSLGSMKMEAMAKPRKTRAPRKVIFLIEMNLEAKHMSEKVDVKELFKIGQRQN